MSTGQAYLSPRRDVPGRRKVSEKAAAGNRKEKVSQIETFGRRRGREAGRESLQVQREREHWAVLL